MWSSKTISLPAFGIKVVLYSNGGGTISSDLHEDDDDDIYSTAVDTLESMILACACAGINIEDHAFVEAIETTANAIFNNCDE